MKWIKWGITPKNSKDATIDFGSYLGITEHGQVGQMKFVGKKFYHDFDCARHYPIKEGFYTHYTEILNTPKQ